MDQFDETTMSPRERAMATHGTTTIAETLRGDRLLSRGMVTYPPAHDTDAWAALHNRPSLAKETSPDTRLSEVQIDGVICRVVTPRDPWSGTCLHFHGGGWAFGSHLSQDPRLLQLAEATRTRVISVGYRTVPDVTVLDVMDDCQRVMTQVANQEHGFLAILGESAGAQLAIMAMIADRRRGGRPLDAAVLSYGMYDLAGTPSQRREARYAQLGEAILPGADEQRLRSADLSPLYADLEGMPPARFVCGTRDPLLDDTLMLEARWRTVARTELDLIAGAHHGFTLADTITTRETLQRDDTFILTAQRG